MSGIVGMWNLDGTPVERCLLSRLSATLAHRGADGEGLWSDGPVGFGCQMFRVTPESASEVQPLIHRLGVVVVFDGRLDDREELLKVLDQPELSITSPDPLFVAAAYSQFGENFATWLNGDFAFGLFDPKRKQLMIARDPLGVRPLYYCRTGNTFLFASEIKAILAHPNVTAKPDNGTLAEFLLGAPNCIDPKATFFQGISRMRGGHVAVVMPDKTCVRPFWEFDPMREIRLGSFEEYAEAFRQHFAVAVKRRLRSQRAVAIAVSGGVDSSSVFCVAQRLVRDEGLKSVSGFTYANWDGTPSDEDCYVRDIEANYGIAVERVRMRPGLLDSWQQHFWHGEVPMIDWKWRSTREYFKAISQSGARVLLSGNWADEVLLDWSHMFKYLPQLRWRELGRQLREYSRWHDGVEWKAIALLFLKLAVYEQIPNGVVRVLRKIRRRTARRHRAWYTETFRRLTFSGGFTKKGPHKFASHHAKSLYWEIRSPYNVLRIDWLNGIGAQQGLELAYPFLDRDLLAFLLAIPGEAQMWKGIPKAILREAMSGTVPSTITGRRWKSGADDLVNSGIEQDYAQIMKLLSSNGLAAKFGYLDEAFLRSRPNRIEAASAALDPEARWILDALGLELWLRSFFER